jgi:hypothetical protein
MEKSITSLAFLLLSEKSNGGDSPCFDYQLCNKPLCEILHVIPLSLDVENFLSSHEISYRDCSCEYKTNDDDFCEDKGIFCKGCHELISPDHLFLDYNDKSHYVCNKFICIINFVKNIGKDTTKNTNPIIRKKKESEKNTKKNGKRKKSVPSKRRKKQK